jgi:hypothetical protein
MWLTSEPDGRKLTAIEQSRCTYPVHWDGVHRMDGYRVELPNGLEYQHGPMTVMDA